MKESQVIVISGGSRGLGKAFVEHFIKHGDVVATFSKSESDFIRNTKREDPQQNNLYWESIDARNYRAIKRFVFNVHKRYGRIDALINNVGKNLDQLLSLTTDEEIDEILSINLESVIILTRIVSRIMLQQGGGAILFLSSILGLRGVKGASVYSATKTALNGFSKSIARELGRRNIRVNAIAPGFIETDMTRGMSEERKAQIIRRTPLGRLGTVDDVVGLVRFLLTQDASFITGQTFVVDGGFTC